MTSLPEPDVVVDCLGRPCPVPVVELAKAVAAAAAGTVVEVVSDDPAARHDVPAWARLRGAEYLGEAPHDVGTGYRVRRGD
ncbi:MAG TPA: sulfurtransferase TusA family protein [Mycobacteriales bacterium]|nr:sulfurtransferase TusA family protein [Mycobacteriales bacterium]